MFNKFTYKICFFIPISFDKFFKAGKFEGKANSVHWLACNSKHKKFVRNQYNTSKKS